MMELVATVLGAVAVSMAGSSLFVAVRSAKEAARSGEAALSSVVESTMKLAACACPGNAVSAINIASPNITSALNRIIIFLHLWQSSSKACENIDIDTSESHPSQ